MFVEQEHEKRDTNIFKLAASLYSMASNEYSQQDILLHILKCNFVENSNSFQSYYEISSSVLDNYKIAGGVLSLTDNFKTIQEGNAVSEMVLKNNQKIS